MAEDELTKSESITWKSQREDSGSPDLRLVHFNDVYHIEYALVDHKIVIQYIIG